MFKKTITSLAILKVNSDEGLDHLDNFVPFLTHLIKIKNYNEIIAHKLEKDFNNEYGLVIPYHALISIINRAKKRGYIKKEFGRYFAIKEKIIEDNFAEISTNQVRKINNIIDSFRKYAFKEYNKDISTEEAEGAILSFLKEHDVDILFASQNESAIPEIEVRDTNIFLLNKYINNVFKNDPTVSEYLVDISLGQALVNSILCEEFNSYIYNLEGLHCYLDADLIFNLLGTSGQEIKDAYQSFFNTLLESKVKLILFRHTYEEVDSILRSCLKWINNPLFDSEQASRTMLYFISTDYKKSDIDLFIAQIKPTLDKFNIEIEDKPPYQENYEYQINEKELKDAITPIYHHYETGESDRELTIDRDVDSISAIHRLRKGQIVKTLKEAKHIFITTNSSLAMVVSKFEKGKFETFNIPSCLTDIFMGTTLWVGNPQKYREINRKRLIANVYASLRPNDRLLRKYLNEISLLQKKEEITEEEYFILRSSGVAMKLLQEKTYNDVDNFSNKTAQEILSELKERIKKDEEKKLLAEKGAHEKTKKELRLSTEFREKIDILIGKIAKIISRSIFILISLLLISGFIASLLGALFEGNKIANVFLGIVASIFTIFTILNLIFGFTVRFIESKIEKYIKEKIGKVIEKIRLGQ